MIKIGNTIEKTQRNFWNACVFHPTDAVEDPWGRRILDRMAEDGAIETVRIYTMFEDILYLDENGQMKYDFRLSDLRLDYMVEKGYDLLLAYGGMPDCIASRTDAKTSVSKNKTRYKGKMWNSTPPRDYALWEELCYEYTRHIVERYGIERVSAWHMQCFNEPDIPAFFLSDLAPQNWQERLAAYCKLYEAFEKGVRRVSDRIKIGGPALAWNCNFLGGFMDYIKEKSLKLDFISVHNYGTDPDHINSCKRPLSVGNNMERQREYARTMREHGFENTPLIVDEWGGASHGFFNKEECPGLMFRENEIFSAYYAKLVHDLTMSDLKMEKLIICLSGQHEMVEDFSGFRNFFTLNFIRKPIYNAHLLSARLKNDLLMAEAENEHLSVLATGDKGGYAVLLCYSDTYFTEALPMRTDHLSLPDRAMGKQVTVWCIDRENTNPYRLYEKMGLPEMTEEILHRLREEGNMKPVLKTVYSDPIPLSFSPNAVYLVTAE
ncbi:MAG: hypothetical protein J6S44_00390 [Clostridia bacterium]|nr:hypothetical protein [Clostridia bacterium]